MNPTGDQVMENIVKNADFTAKREFYINGNTRDVQFRLNSLKKLKLTIKHFEKEIVQAIAMDLHKPEFESYTGDLGVVYQEINYAVKRLRKWMKPVRVPTPILHFYTQSRIYQSPLGVVLIIAPWNYPFQLLMAPLVGAIAAGNCIVLKPSHKTKHTAAIIEEVISSAFESEYISVVQGSGSSVVPLLMEKYRFDHVFFSGSQSVGREIGRAAAEKLTPCTLELGGKNPVIIDKNVNLKVAVRRLMWGKFFNAGQSCVAPDYLIIHEDIKEEFLIDARRTLDEFYGTGSGSSADFTHIINNRRMEKLLSYLDSGNIVIGGEYNRETWALGITLIDGVTMDSPLMKEEIFGPILPVLTYREKSRPLEIIETNPSPLAIYVFTRDKSIEKFYRENLSFGGGCINNTTLHFINPHLPFGGTGFSGNGYCHGQSSFRTFSHFKSIMKSATFFDLKLKYPPYSKTARMIITKFLQ